MGVVHLAVHAERRSRHHDVGNTAQLEGVDDRLARAVAQKKVVSKRIDSKNTNVDLREADASQSTTPQAARQQKPATKTPPKPSVAAPERSLVQRMEALQRANEIRTRRAQLKRDLKGGRQSIHDLLLEPPEYVETAKVFDMLLAVPKYGRVKVNKVLQQCRISPSKTIGGLSQRQRTELVSMLRR